MTLTINPIDLVRTRLFSQPPQPLQPHAPSSLAPPPHAPPPPQLLHQQQHAPPTPPRVAASAAAHGPAASAAAAAAVPLPAEAPRYRGVLDCVRRVAAAEGVGAFWKGSLAAFLRIGPHQTLTFVIIGWLQRRLRKSTL